MTQPSSELPVMDVAHQFGSDSTCLVGNRTLGTGRERRIGLLQLFELSHDDAHSTWTKMVLGRSDRCQRRAVVVR